MNQRERDRRERQLREDFKNPPPMTVVEEPNAEAGRCDVCGNPSHHGRTCTGRPLPAEAKPPPEPDHQGVDPHDRIAVAEAERDKLAGENQEQARLLGMSGSREASLLAKLTKTELARQNWENAAAKESGVTYRLQEKLTLAERDLARVREAATRVSVAIRAREFGGTGGFKYADMLDDAVASASGSRREK